jgi:hypothetical protein
MAVLEIPIPQGVAFFTKRIPLDGTDYLFDFSYNQREDAFYFTINDSVGAKLLGPVKIVSNFPLIGFRRYAPGIPPGELWAIAFKSEQDCPGMNRLGADIPLMYYDAEEVGR